MSDSVTPWMAACPDPLSSTISWSFLKFMSIESVMLSNHLICWCPLLLQPSIFPSIRVFSNQLALHIRWPKYWSFSISPSNVYSGLITSRIGWFNLLAVQGNLKSSPIPQFESFCLKACKQINEIWKEIAELNSQTYKNLTYNKMCSANHCVKKRLFN